MENLPDEIVLQILGYLSLGELIQCARVSESFKTICEDSSLPYSSNMLVIKDLTVKDQKSVIDVLIAEPEVKKVKIISWRDECLKTYIQNLIALGAFKMEKSGQLVSVAFVKK